MTTCFDRAFYRDPYCRRLTATLTAVKTEEGRVWVALSDTLFFPGGGGQAADRGFVGPYPVLALAEDEQNVIWHALGAAHGGGDQCPVQPETCPELYPDFPAWWAEQRRLANNSPKPEDLVVGSSFELILDWPFRFDQMQHHSAEHFVSGIAHQLWGCENVGFHIGERYMTIDFDRYLNPKQVEDLELLANAAAWRALPLQAQLTTEAEAETAGLDYRAKRHTEGDLRLIEVPGVDRCACCGLHVHSSGEVGSIMIANAEKHRGGVRLSILCGSRALRCRQAEREEGRAVGQLLSVPFGQILPAVTDLLAERDALAIDLAAARRRLNAAALNAGLLTVPAGSSLSRAALAVVEGTAEDLNEALKQFSQAGGLAVGLLPLPKAKAADPAAEAAGASDAADAAAAVSSPAAKTLDWQFAAVDQSHDLQAFAAALRTSIGLKGGGRGGFIGGKISGPDEASIRAAVTAALATIG